MVGQRIYRPIREKIRENLSLGPRIGPINLPVTMARPVLFLAGMAAWTALFSGCTTATRPVDTAPPVSPNTLGEAYHDAELISREEQGRHTALGRGDSMAPIFSDDTLLVINPIQYEALGPGMTVAYVNSRGQRVVHQLVTKTRDGWMVAGYHNDRIDGELVTPKNLLGVVYASFYPSDEKDSK